MAERRAENLRFAVGVHPDDHVIFLGVLPVGLRERDRVRPELFVFVKLVLGIVPRRGEALHHGMLGLQHLHFEIAVFLVTHRSLANELAPFVRFRGAITVGRTMQHHRGQAVFMRLGDALDERDIGDRAEALVVQHHVKTLRPIRIVVERNHRLAFVAAVVDNRPLDVGARADSLGENFFLLLVIVTTAAAHEQRLDGFRLSGAGGRGRGQQRASERGGEGKREKFRAKYFHKIISVAEKKRAEQSPARTGDAIDWPAAITSSGRNPRRVGRCRRACRRPTERRA